MTNERLTAALDKAGVRKISTDLWGIFFEDISHSADGGLASELVQNGAFEYNRADSRDWSSYTAWRKIVPEGSFAAFGVGVDDPVANENPRYAVVEVRDAPASLENVGFDGMVFRAGETYRCSLWARTRGGTDAMPIDIALIGDWGETLARSRVTAETRQWCQLAVDLTVAADGTASYDAADDDGETRGGTDGIARESYACASAADDSAQDAPSGKPNAPDDPANPANPAAPAYSSNLTNPVNPVGPANPPTVARQGMLRFTFTQPGELDLDFISLEPAATTQGLTAHMRPDLVQALAELKPRFMRFPGGCITHGLGMENMYHWDRTIGAVEHRPHNFNTWGYHQSFRIGYYEYLCLCEAIGAKPLPVLPAAVSCQNTSQGPVPIAERDMPTYIDEVLALVEFCNGDADTPWGARRAELGHPEPFGLEYLGIGNEDLIDPVFKDRFQRIFDAVKAAYPEIVVVGTVGPAPEGQDYELGWAYAREAGIPVVDEHSYQSPSWWFHNLHHYDDADRGGPKVYLGEYGSWGTQLINGLSEAAFMSHMELNGDVVSMASYAPLFAKNGHESWNPDLIYFDNERVYRTISYWVQRMFATTTCDVAYPVALDGPATLTRELPENIGLRILGGAHADIRDLSIETADGETIALPDVHYLGNGPVDTTLAASGESYTLRARVTYWEGMWGVQFAMGDVNGPNHNIVSLGRGHSVQVVRDGSGYALAGTEVSMDAVRPGTTWDVRVEVADRGARMRLFIDGELIADGREDPAEPRRTVTVAQDTAAGMTYVRVVNAMPESVQVDLTQVCDGLGLAPERRAHAKAVVLAGDDEYAGRVGQEAPYAPQSVRIDLAGGTYEAPAWSFTVITL
ncbi:alpha-L-arabinofuranosidase C-terminal domain-containing protein [Bifidobacterium eulemuris]|uniref:non-reducing end alpha-L-arabinofuranosidase n=2 Tax=Bifidobacterium eulemuris TaxID=1765219 RepID=A0A261G527_9BIFI|nr:alpha-L-arabinofuranosidase C-terminal domain-containing protein [Bifidobacterium eulemuris]OZG66508.1 alpha-L-arabinofuranosidase [Bifidobacterium eulemuris]